MKVVANKDSTLKILLLEDNPDDADHLVEVLHIYSSPEFKISHFTILEDALKSLRTHSYDVIVTDLRLPDSHGPATVDRFRQIAVDTPIIVTSGFNDENTELQSLQFGADHFLPKDDVDQNRLRSAIDNVLQRHPPKSTPFERENLSGQTNFHALVNSSADAMIVVGIDGTIHFLNAAGIKLFRQSPTEILGTRFKHPLDQRSREIQIQRPEADPAIVEMRAVEILWRGEKCFLAMLRDITERKFIEASLHESERKNAEERLKIAKLESLGLLAGGIAHDLNNILMAIDLNLDEAMELAFESSHQQQIILQDCRTASRRARHLSTRLLAFSKSSPANLRTTELDPVLREAIDFALRGSNLAAEYDLQSGHHPVAIDVGQFQQVVNNIVINARDVCLEGKTLFIQTREISIKSNQIPGLSKGRYIETRFKDQGPGIPPEIREKIFDPYFTTKKTGHGIGLATCYAIMAKHRGTILAESEPGKGATFILYLPISRHPLDSESTEAAPPSKGTSRILIVDDEESIRRNLARALCKLGYSAEHVPDGETAVSYYRRSIRQKRPYDVIILDGIIPGRLGGEAALKRLLKINPKAKVILLSGYSEENFSDQWKLSGFSDRLLKPCSLSEVTSKIEAILPEES